MPVLLKLKNFEVQFHFEMFFESFKASLLLWAKTLLQRHTLKFKRQKRGESLHIQRFFIDRADKILKNSSLLIISILSPSNKRVIISYFLSLR